MDSNKALRQIADGLLAIIKIQEIYNSNLNLRSDPNSTVRANDKSVVADVLRTVAGFSSDTNKKAIGDAVDRGYQYSEAYKNIKHNFRSMRSQDINRETLIRTLGSMRPVLSNRHRTLIDKAMKIYEILNS